MATGFCTTGLYIFCHSSFNFFILIVNSSLKWKKGITKLNFYKYWICSKKRSFGNDLDFFKIFRTDPAMPWKSTKETLWRHVTPKLTFRFKQKFLRLTLITNSSLTSVELTVSKKRRVFSKCPMFLPLPSPIPWWLNPLNLMRRNCRLLELVLIFGFLNVKKVRATNHFRTSLPPPLPSLPSFLWLGH